MEKLTIQRILNPGLNNIPVCCKHISKPVLEPNTKNHWTHADFTRLFSRLSRAPKRARR